MPQLVVSVIDGTGDGDTAPDWEVLDPHHVRLRAEPHRVLPRAHPIFHRDVQELHSPCSHR